MACPYTSCTPTQLATSTFTYHRPQHATAATSVRIYFISNYQCFVCLRPLYACSISISIYEVSKYAFQSIATSTPYTVHTPENLYLCSVNVTRLDDTLEFGLYVRIRLADWIKLPKLQVHETLCCLAHGFHNTANSRIEYRYTTYTT